MEPSGLCRGRYIPYGRHWVDDTDVKAVVEVLRSEWLTTGPLVDAFEQAIADFVGTGYAVAVSSGTAALHASLHAVEIGPGDEVIVPPITFVATANAVVFQGATPVFADVHPNTLLLDPLAVAKKITARTKAIVAVDYGGQPCDYDALRQIAETHHLALLADSCHALGATWKNRNVGALADLSAFSFHPVKHITTAEGGMITTNDALLAQRMRAFRNHGISTDHRQRSEMGSWFYEMVDLGYNYRLSDLQCALGISQLRKLPQWLLRRQEIAAHYSRAFQDVQEIRPLAVEEGVSHAFHLFVVQLQFGDEQRNRSTVFRSLRAAGIGANVHYIPVHLHPYYRQRFATGPGLCPIAEAAYERILSLPIFPAMSDDDTDYVIATLQKIVSGE